MLTELAGKAGALCEPAKKGELRCPLIVRPTSEDVVTGNIFGTLKAVNPRWWLADFLNEALGYRRFRQQIYRNFRIELWQRQSSFPRNLLPWEEGQTEVDVELSWENPCTTVFIEMKYGSPLSATTVNNNGNGKYAADQLVRNARVGLYKCGWYNEERLFEKPVRDFAVILFSPNIGNPLVQKYRADSELVKAMPFSERLRGLPASPFIGELSFAHLTKILVHNSRLMSRAERQITMQLVEYLEFKLSQLRRT